MVKDSWKHGNHALLHNCAKSGPSSIFPSTFLAFMVKFLHTSDQEQLRSNVWSLGRFINLRVPGRWPATGHFVFWFRFGEVVLLCNCHDMGHS
jgi:hypothetical protein